MAMKRSSRRSARGSSRAAKTSGRASARGSASERGEAPAEREPKGRARKKGGGGGTELAICLGVIVILIVAVIFFWMKRDTEFRQYKQAKRQLRKAREENVNRAYRAWQNAYQVGRAFVTGEQPDAKPEDLLGPFQGKENIYNVIFDRQYKDKKNKPAEQQIAMDKSRLRVMRYGSPTTKDKITMYYGMAEGETLPIMLAEKFISAQEGDKKNMGGKITVIVKAEKEK